MADAGDRAWVPGGHLVLVGLPGAGKSVLGASLARRLRLPFLDFDVEIERREGLSVVEIFARRGEAYFRARERELTAELMAAPPAVLAPGGGWVANHGVTALLRPPARIIYLKVRPETALARLGASRAERPLLRVPDPLAELQRLLREREPYYLSADLVVEADIVDIQELTNVLERLASTPRGG